jgi:nucleoid DNA-binding protein
MKKEKSLGIKELIRMVAESSKYHLYEVEDVLLHAIAHMQQSVSKGKSVKLNGLGVISRKLYKPTLVSLGTRPPFMVYNSVGMSIKPDSTMKKLLKEHLESTNPSPKQ